MVDLNFSRGTASSDTVKVSVCVISYNHERYIQDCLEGILRQKTNFRFEIVVRDDFSNDQTAELLKNYAVANPDFVTLIDASNNIGANSNLLETFSHAHGTYVAICEGDDYWIDDLKLQKQVEIMEQNPTCTFTAHPCRVHDQHGLGEKAFAKSSQLMKFNGSDVLLVSGQYAPTASYMFRKTAIENMPDWFADGPVGDFFLEMYGMRAGFGLYLPDAMSAYRTFSSNSWSTKYNEQQLGNMIDFSSKMIRCLSRMQDEPEFTGLDFSSKRAAIYFNMAIGHLLSSQYDDFSRAISNSHTEVPNLSVTQSLLYRLRTLPRLAHFLYKRKRQLDKGVGRMQLNGSS